MTGEAATLARLCRDPRGHAEKRTFDRTLPARQTLAGEPCPSAQKGRGRNVPAHRPVAVPHLPQGPRRRLLRMSKTGLASRRPLRRSIPLGTRRPNVDGPQFGLDRFAASALAAAHRPQRCLADCELAPEERRRGMLEPDP